MASLVSPEASLHGLLADGHFLTVPSPGLSSVLMHFWCLFLFLQRTLVLLDQDPARLASFYLSYFFKDPVSKYGHILRSGG